MNHVLIVSLSRSGGKLLRMLLDGHPEFNVFPFEHWNRPSKNKIPTRRIEMFDRLSLDEKLETAGAQHAERKLSRVHPREQVAEIMQTWRAAAADTRTLPAMYERLSDAYFASVGGSPDRAVVNHCGSLCRFTREQVDSVFGKGKHLLTIRDPRAVFSSMQALVDGKFTPARVQQGNVSASTLKRHLERQETIDAVSGYLREFCEDYRSMVAGYAASRDVIRIRFEDLVTSPESTMRQLAAQLAVGWDPALLEPTQLGASHRANSSFSRQGSAIDGRAAHDWVDRIAQPVRKYIEDSLASEMAALGYQPAGQSGSRLVLETAPILRSYGTTS